MAEKTDRLQTICMIVAMLVGLGAYQVAAPWLWGDPDIRYPNWPRIVGAAAVAGVSTWIGSLVATLFRRNPMQ